MENFYTTDTFILTSKQKYNSKFQELGNCSSSQNTKKLTNLNQKLFCYNSFDNVLIITPR